MRCLQLRCVKDDIRIRWIARGTLRLGYVHGRRYWPWSPRCREGMRRIHKHEQHEIDVRLLGRDHLENDHGTEGEVFTI